MSIITDMRGSKLYTNDHIYFVAGDVLFFGVITGFTENYVFVDEYLPSNDPTRKWCIPTDQSHTIGKCYIHTDKIEGFTL